MRNYGIAVPNVVGSFGGGIEAAKSLDYFEDRKNKQKRQAMMDFSTIAQNVNRDDPAEVKQALAWAAGRSPQMKNVVWDAMQKGPEASLNLIDMFQKKTKKTGSEQLTLYGPSNATKRVAVEKGKDFTPEEGWSLSKPTKGMKIYDSSGNLIVDTGGGEMSKKAQGELESGSISDYESLHKLEEIKNIYDKGFLTYAGKTKGWFGALKEKAGFELSENDKDFITTKKKFEQRVNQFFNAYKKLITGAASSEKEVEFLKKSVLNTDQSPTEFEAAYDDMTQGYQRSIRINNRLLREGVKRGTKNWGKRFDGLYMSGGDDVVTERAAELKTKNPKATDEDIATILMNEGYQ